MENYLIALAGYGFVFLVTHFIGRKKSNKQGQYSADFTLSTIKSNSEHTDERMETKSVA